MPCSDSNLEITWKKPTKQTLNAVKLRIEKLESALCAIMSELETAGCIEGVLEKTYGFDFHKFWDLHKDHDKTRLTKKLAKLSNHEKKAALDLLKRELG